MHQITAPEIKISITEAVARTPAAMSASVTVLMTHCLTQKVGVRVEDSRCTGKLIGH